MINLFKDCTQEEKRKKITKIALTIIVPAIVFGLFHIFLWSDLFEPKYTFILDGEEMESIMICEEKWHYEDLDFLPCVINETFGGLFPQTINWSLSPQENCHFWGGEFTGFNVYNETRAKEIYDLLLPECFELKEEEISYVWLNASECFCVDCEDVCLINETLGFEKNCNEYDCGGGLIVKRK